MKYCETAFVQILIDNRCFWACVSIDTFGCSWHNAESQVEFFARTEAFCFLFCRRISCFVLAPPASLLGIFVRRRNGSVLWQLTCTEVP